MATPTYELIETTTLTSSASSVTFSSITQDYRDLVLVFDGLLTSQTTNLALIPNGTSSTGAAVFMEGTGSTSSGTDTTLTIGRISTSNKCVTILQIMDYSATDKHKSMLFRSNNSGEVKAQAQRWASTSAITSLTLDPEGGASIAADSTFSLYGIAS